MRRGFTLLELMAAITLAGVALIAAQRLLDQLADAHDQLTRERISMAADRNGVRLLRSLIDRAEVGPDAFMTFRGGAKDASFHTRCDAPGGWLEPCHITLNLVSTGAAESVMVTATGRQPIRLLTWKPDATLRYLEANMLSRAWREEWHVAIVLPAAIGIVSEGDTLVFRIGGRS